jgi:hypothetical protein
VCRRVRIELLISSTWKEGFATLLHEYCDRRLGRFKFKALLNMIPGVTESHQAGSDPVSSAGSERSPPYVTSAYGRV